MSNLGFSVGDKVRVKRPDDFYKNIACKVAERVGVVKFIRSDNKIFVDFPPIGRKKLFTFHFYNRDLEKTND